jgi:hypothetical protein
MPARSLPASSVALLTALTLAGCGSVEQTMIERGFPPAYAQGYADGCASGKQAAGGWFAQARKDTRRYGADDQYTDGWDDGFAECRRDMAAMVWHARVRNRNRDK